MLALLGSANRDPEVFTEPERFDLDRTDNPHLAFGRGIHFCLGAQLARIEAAAALRGLLGRFPEIRRVDSALRWRDNITVRGLARLEVRF